MDILLCSCCVYASFHTCSQQTLLSQIYNSELLWSDIYGDGLFGCNRRSSLSVVVFRLLLAHFSPHALRCDGCLSCRSTDSPPQPGFSLLDSQLALSSARVKVLPMKSNSLHRFLHSGTCFCLCTASQRAVGGIQVTSFCSAFFY